MANEVEIERMVVRLQADVQNAVAGINAVKKAAAGTGNDLKQVSDNMVSFGKTIDNLGTKMGAFAGSMIAMNLAHSPFQFITDSVRAAGDAEEMKINIGTMLDSVDKGNELFGELKKFAANTPMTMPSILQGTTSLLQNQVAAEDLIPTMKMLGDVALGNNEKFQRLVYTYGQMSNEGRVTWENTRELITAGFNPLRVMSEQTGKSVATLKEEMSQGKITMQMLDKAFQAATTSGGKFNDGMAKSARGWKGLMSTMDDATVSLKESVGTAIIENFKLKEVLAGVTAQTEAATVAFESLPQWIRTGTVATTAFVGGMMSLTMLWKVGSLLVGMLVGNLRHMVTTVQSCTAATNAFVASSRAQWVMMDNGHLVFQRNMKAVWALRAAYAALAVGVAYGLTMAISAASTSWDDYNRTTEEAARLTEQRVDRIKRATKDVTERLQDISGTDEGKLRIDMEIEVARGEVDKAVKAVEDARKQVHEIRSNVIPPDATSEWLELDTRFWSRMYSSVAESLNIGDPAKDATEGLQDAEKAAEAYRSKLKQLEVMSNKSVQSQQQLAEQVDAINIKLKEQHATRNMSGEEKELQRLARMGADVSEAYATIAESEAVKTQEELAKKVRQTAEALLAETETLKMNEHEKRVYELATKGASGAEFEYMKRISEANFLAQYQQGIMEKGRSVVDRFKTPVEKLADAEAELSEMFLAGAIDAETYAKAIAQAAEGVTHLKAAIEDASSAGSVAAAVKVAEYADMLTGFQGDKRSGDVVGRASGVRETEGFARQDKFMADALARIAQYTQAMAEKEGITVATGGD